MYKNVLIFTLILGVCMVFAGDFVLVKDGNPQVSILNPGEAYKNKLKLFNEDLAETTGTQLTVTDKKQSAQLRFAIKNDTHPLTNDNFTVSFPKKQVMLVECTPVSIQWALNWILEEYAGVHYLFNATCGKSHTPVKTVAIPRKTVKHAPSFPLGRDMVLSTAHTHPWMKQKPTVHLNHELWIHAFPAEKYFNDNSYPEAIRPIRNGKKLQKIPNKATHWQPCYSNPETARIAIENILSYLKKNPAEHSISLLANDCGGYCECDGCKIANGGHKEMDQSNVYYKWVNKVAEGVCKVYPDLIITCGAYTQTISPPDFKLHKNVCVTLCMDLYAATDPATMIKQKKLIKAWGEKAATLGIWDYCWGHPYLPPRMYFKVHAEMLRYLHQNGCRYYFGENENYDAKEGPKVFAIMKLAWDINTDLEKYLDDWYRYAVGEKAAPYLKRYYEFWEKYYAGPATKTPWFASRSATYMTFGDISHSFGLKPGDLKQTRTMMENVVILASTPEEKIRAKHLMRHFEYMESLLKIYGSEYIAIDGKLHSAQEAVNLLNVIPENYKYVAIKNKIAAQMKVEPWLAQFYNNKYIGNHLRFAEDGTSALLSQIVLTADHAKDPGVKNALRRLANTKELPGFLRNMAHVLQDPSNVKNLFTNGSVEKETLLPNFSIYKGHIRKNSGMRSTEYAADGKYSFMVRPTDYTLVYLREKAEPDTLYVMTMKLFTPSCNAEAFMNFVMYPSRNGSNQDYRNPPKIKFSNGVWQTFTVFCRTKENSDGIMALIFLRNFEGHEKVYIDDVKLIKIDK